MCLRALQEPPAPAAGRAGAQPGAAAAPPRAPAEQAPGGGAVGAWHTADAHVSVGLAPGLLIKGMVQGGVGGGGAGAHAGARAPLWAGAWAAPAAPEVPGPCVGAGPRAGGAPGADVRAAAHYLCSVGAPRAASAPGQGRPAAPSAPPPALEKPCADPAAEVRAAAQYLSAVAAGAAGDGAQLTAAAARLLGRPQAPPAPPPGPGADARGAALPPAPPAGAAGLPPLQTEAAGAHDAGGGPALGAPAACAGDLRSAGNLSAADAGGLAQPARALHADSRGAQDGPAAGHAPAAAAAGAAAGGTVRAGPPGDAAAAAAAAAEAAAAEARLMRKGLQNLTAWVHYCAKAAGGGAPSWAAHRGAPTALCT